MPATAIGNGEARQPGAPPGLLLSCRGINKTFGAQRALADVDFDVKPGQIHGLVGENGAGKSTLIKCIGGNERPDSGTIAFAGEVHPIAHPWEAQELGIGIVHQHPQMVEGLSIAENVALGSPLEQRSRGIVSWRREYRRSQALLERVGVDRDAREPASRLSTHQRQLVALARALRLGLKLLILDEITAPLTYLEIDRLFALIRGICAEGVGVVFVSHRLGEVFDLTESVTVMRDGRRVGTTPTAQLTREDLISQMIGRESTVLVPTARDHSDVAAEPAATVRGLSGGAARDVGFEIMPGEILGLAGLSGSGRTSILETLYGLHGEAAHELRLEGEAVSFSDPKGAIAAGVAFVSEDRTVSGYVPTFTISQTATLPFLGTYGRNAWLRPRVERGAGRQLVERLDVRPPDPRARMSALSGGNQQKVILGRWLAHPLKLLLLDEPTHGVDVGAKENIYGLLQEIAAEGIPIVFASSEFEELEGLCRRVLLLHEGRLAGELSDEEVSADLILASLLRMHIGNGGNGGDGDERPED